MSQAHDEHWSFLHLGNPFRSIFPKGYHVSSKLRVLLNSFEQSLASSLEKLKPERSSDVISLSWMRSAVDCLTDVYTSIENLITELKLPISDWDAKWLDIYLNSSVKLLDICIALSSELARLEQSQLLLRYTLHTLDEGSSTWSTEHIKQVVSSLEDWMNKVRSPSPRLEGCSLALQSLAEGIQLTKVKNSAKGKLLMRALYGVKVISVFVCGVLAALLLGHPKPLMELNVSDEFLWSGVFNDLKEAVNAEVSLRYSDKTIRTVHELEAVLASAERLHFLITSGHFEAKLDGEVNSITFHRNSCSDSPVEGIAQNGAHGDSNSSITPNQNKGAGNQDAATNSSITPNQNKGAGNQDAATVNGSTAATEDIAVLKSSITLHQTKDVDKAGPGNGDDAMVNGSTDATEDIATDGVAEKLKDLVSCNSLELMQGSPVGVEPRRSNTELADCISSMAKCSEKLGLEMDSLSQGIGDFFQVVLAGRDALLCNLRS